MSIEAMKLALEAIQDLRGYRPDIDSAIETLRASLSQQPATGEPVAWPLRAQVWKRESTQEWVLEIAGTLGDTDMNIRHTQPLSVAYENVPGLPAFYTRPAPSVLGDVARDAERWRTFLATRPSNTHEAVNAAIDAAMLAAKKASA